MQLHDYLVDERPFLKEQKIDLQYFDDTGGTLHIGCRMPGFEYVAGSDSPDLGLSIDFEDLYDFISEFMITDVKEVNDITRDSLYKRFLVGRADMLCSLDGDCQYQLKFYWIKNKLFAIRTSESFPIEGAIGFEVPEFVKTPEEIIAYTKHYINKEIAAM